MLQQGMDDRATAGLHRHGDLPVWKAALQIGDPLVELLGRVFDFAIGTLTGLGAEGVGVFAVASIQTDQYGERVR